MSTKLLLADDSLTVQRVVALTLSGEDIDVVTVDDGDEAIQRIPRERPDIVLADVGLPKRSGYEVAAFIKDHPELSHVPVLLLAGAFEPVDEPRIRQVGAAGVLVKPLEPQQVVARVRALVRPSRAAEPDPPAAGPASPAPPPLPAGRSAQNAVADPRQILPAEPRPGRPELDAADAGASTSLDDYFDRLDAAFATLGTTKAPPARGRLAPGEDRGQGVDVPTFDEVLGMASLSRVSAPAAASEGRGPETGSASAASAASPTSASDSPPADVPNALADLFHLLLAVEQGQVGADSIRIAGGARLSEIPDELVERVAHRVLERLAPDAVRDIVADIVSPIAERLVREEIDRIRNG